MGLPVDQLVCDLKAATNMKNKLCHMNALFESKIEPWKESLIQPEKVSPIQSKQLSQIQLEQVSHIQFWIRIKIPMVIIALALIKYLLSRQVYDTEMMLMMWLTLAVITEEM